jgi:hypothetical protein
MSLKISDLEVGLKKYVQAITDAENDKEFAEMIVEALEKKIEIKKLEEIENGE